MTKEQFEVLYSIKKYGIDSYKEHVAGLGLNEDEIKKIVAYLMDNLLVSETGITELGIESIKPYKVDNAIIMAAGMSTRFVPLSLEKPKGLLIVKNEVLIERQIEQLQEAGISDIIIVLGYKKEAFFYLEDKYTGIKFVINSEYNIKNNTHTLYLVREYLGNSFICSSDDYFVDNPFEEYVYQSYYASEYVDEKTDEWYMNPDDNGYIAAVTKSGNAGYIMLGHVYWDRAFSARMVDYLTTDYEIGNYSQSLWEQILMDNVSDFPLMEIKCYPKETIFEFDSLDELRRFDENYVHHTHSKIMKNISGVLDCKESDILNFEPIKEGLTNSSFRFEVNGKYYVYRHPGDGTESIISRTHEKKALELAKSIGVDPTYIYLDDKTGWKLSSFVDGIRVPDYSSVEDSKRIIQVMRELHSKMLSVDWTFKPWEEAGKIEKILKEEKGGIEDSEFEQLKINVEKCFNACNGDGIEMRFCHCDTYAPNWMLTDDGRTILIDWEYAGNADPGCDVGTYIMDSMWDIDKAKEFIKEYCQDDYNETTQVHYLSYTAILSYYWYVWALYREACGAIMGESLYNWHIMAKRYSKYVVNNLINS